jgi:hypothetical protein
MDEQNRLSLSPSFSLLPQLSLVLRHDERAKKTTLMVVVTMGKMTSVSICHIHLYRSNRCLEMTIE